MKCQPYVLKIKFLHQLELIFLLNSNFKDNKNKFLIIFNFNKILFTLIKIYGILPNNFKT